LSGKRAAAHTAPEATDTGAEAADTGAEPTDAERTDAEPTDAEPGAGEPTDAEATDAGPGASEPGAGEPTDAEATDAGPGAGEPTAPQPGAPRPPVPDDADRFDVDGQRVDPDGHPVHDPDTDTDTNPDTNPGTDTDTDTDTGTDGDGERDGSTDGSNSGDIEPRRHRGDPDEGYEDQPPARTHPGHPGHPGSARPPGTRPKPPKALVKPRRHVMLHVHASQAALHGQDGVARLERGDQPISTALVRDWCGRTDTQLTVLPIRDLAEHIHTTQYETTPRLDTQVEQINQTCVFPWCERPARACDKDHNVAFDDGGATCSCNIAPLCRRHHRLKTFTTWCYQPLDTGSYLWTSPHGRHYLRDDTGTTDVTPTTRTTTPGHAPAGEAPPGEAPPGHAPPGHAPPGTTDVTPTTTNTGCLHPPAA